jgi:hypothetical protein
MLGQLLLGTPRSQVPSSDDDQEMFLVDISWDDPP